MDNQKLIDLFRKTSPYLKKHAPTILTCMASIGVVATATLSAKATPKAMDLLEKAKSEKKDKLTKMEIVKTVGNSYIPTVVVGAGTIACIFGANILNKKSQASLISAYTLIEQSYSRYRKAANAVYGEDADAKIRVEAAKEIYVSGTSCCGEVVTYDPEHMKDEERLFYDEFSARYFTSTMASVLNAQYHFNRNYILGGARPLNEYYEFLGIDEVAGGDVIGWEMSSGIEWVDFENVEVLMDDGLECCTISFVFNPEPLEVY